MKRIEIALIDHDDSFTFNIVEVLRNFNDVKLSLIKYTDLRIATLDNYDKIILSPGPCLPKNYPKTFQLIEKFYQSKAILGICLGHQAICEYFGAELYNLNDVVHGVDKEIVIDHYNTIFNNIPNNTKVGLYHSWAVKEKSLPKELQILAKTANSILMSVKHKEYPIYGIQFHPESFLTQHGELILRNFIDL